MSQIKNKEKLTEAIRHALNCNSTDNDLNVPDYVLAQALVAHLETIGDMVNERDRWFDFDPRKRFTFELTNDTEDNFAP